MGRPNLYWAGPRQINNNERFICVGPAQYMYWAGPTFWAGPIYFGPAQILYGWPNDFLIVINKFFSF